ncbi:hypothetical protein S245_062441, partial [Arachis hypogaea]
AYTSELQLKVDHLLEENARLKRQQQKVNLLLRFHAPKNVTRKRGLMLKLTSLHLLMMKIWTPLNTLRTGSSTLRIRRLKGLTHTRTTEMI